jgi:DNA-binding NtrC family response regulator
MQICIVDDDLENAHTLSRALAGHRRTVFTDPDEALAHVSRNRVDVLIADQRMPGMTGIELICKTKQVAPDVISVIVSGFADQGDLISAVNSNLVFRYILKPFSHQELRDTVASAGIALETRRSERRLHSELAIQNRLLLEENDSLRAGKQPILDLFTGGDPAMGRIKELALLYALSDDPVLVTGETGTGKELLARIIHHFSPRRDQPFVVVNCSNLGDYLLESTLFGHVRGAFTGAARDKVGLVKDASEGTLFLDEIGDLPAHLQPKLLRFIQFQTFTPVGGNKQQSVNVRLVSSTNKDLKKMTEAGDFRSDLFYRLNTFQIHLPPLRQRRHDIVPIMRRIARANGLELPPISDEARAVLESYDYPGNTRELQSVVERVSLLIRQRNVEQVTVDLVRAALSSDPVVDIEDELTVRVPTTNEHLDIHSVLSRIEKALIGAVLSQEGGNISATARRLGLSRQGLRNKLRMTDDAVDVQPISEDAHRVVTKLPPL